MPERSQDDSGAFNEAGSGVVNDTKPDRPKPGEKPRVNVQAEKISAPAKSSPKMQEQTYRRTSGDAGEREPAYTRKGGATADEIASYKPPVKNPNYSNEGRGRELTKRQQIEQEIDSIKPTAEQTQKGLETASAMAGGVGLKALSAAAKKLATPKAAKLKTYDQPALPGPSTKTLPAPTKRLGFDKRSAFEKKRAERAAKRRGEMLDENAKSYGLDPKSPGYEAASGAVRKEMGGKDFALKKGGKVKPEMKKMAFGGSVSNASKRADGIATKGKTRCKMR
jgi:hypothetical protein